MKNVIKNNNIKHVASLLKLDVRVTNIEMERTHWHSSYDSDQIHKPKL